MVSPSQESWVTRRRCLQAGAVSALGGALVAPRLGQAAAPAPTRVARIAHLSDIHVQPELRAAAGAAKCLQHVQSLPDRVDLVVTGGDTVMDAFEVDAARSAALGELWRGLLKSECSLPVRAVIGNHDVRPWTQGDAVGGDGKKAAQELLGLDARYYAFDLGNWRLIVLDTVQPHGADYAGFVDPEQRAWLEGELATVGAARPVAIVSHIPILTVTALVASADNAASGDHRIPGGFMLRDGASLHYLLREHPNVKLCLSGHMHLVDRCEIDGMTYICGGAVCANWWKGRRQKVDEGYGLLDLYDTGLFSYAYTTYGWEAAG
ncbi:MAG TPA: metallophosphoesterase [Lacipirellulaceae bacterium]|nr:metallophosphoesterase [Lacipirellulaceae bacterium]